MKKSHTLYYITHKSLKGETEEEKKHTQTQTCD